MPTAAHTSLPPIRALLGAAIDYAGLFPPAELPLETVVHQYVGYRDGPDGWALGRLVVPVSRFGELEAVLAALPAPRPLVAISAVFDGRVVDDVDTVTRFSLLQGGSGPRVDAVEVRAADPAAARAVLAALPRRWRRYVEVSLERDPTAVLDVIAEAGAFAKVRPGGTTAAAFPPPELLATFIHEAARRRLAFKATAGLHHPIRGSYRLTYAKDAPVGTMYGYLNLLLASAITWGGGDPIHAREALLETDPAALWINGDAIAWRHGRFPTKVLKELRARFFHGFGSCSFTEPMEEFTLGPSR